LVALNHGVKIFDRGRLPRILARFRCGSLEHPRDPRAPSSILVLLLDEVCCEPFSLYKSYQNLLRRQFGLEFGDSKFELILARELKSQLIVSNGIRIGQEEHPGCQILPFVILVDSFHNIELGELVLLKVPLSLDYLLFFALAQQVNGRVDGIDPIPARVALYRHIIRGTVLKVRVLIHCLFMP
jgi:hypothetical protein